MNLIKKNQWLLPNEICLAKGYAVARNLMFETQKDHKIFLELWDRYLGGMTEVINYHLSSTDWTILFRTKSEKEIIYAYKKQRKKSKKAKMRCTLKEPKRMISEHIRIFLSQYVRRSNTFNERKGTKVLERFHKCILRSHIDFEKVFHIISKQERKPIQNRAKYMADERYYDVRKEICLEGILKVGNAFYKGVLAVEEGILKCMRLIAPNSSVLRKFWNQPNLKQNLYNSS